MTDSEKEWQKVIYEREFAKQNERTDQLVRQLRKLRDEMEYRRGYEDGKRDAMKWISVKERLPEEDGEYLIGWATSDEMYLSCFTRDCFGMSFGLRDKEQEHRPAWYYIDDEWGEVEWDNVEYWMEKPAPPETKGEENE